MVDEAEPPVDESEQLEPDIAPVYREALASISRMLSLAPDEAMRLKVFENAVSEVISKWKGIDRSDALDALYDIAESRGFDADWVQSVFARAFEEAEQPRTNGKGKASEAKAKAKEPTTIPIVSPFPIDESKIPPRDWAIPGFLMRRHITVLVAPSGSGKSLLTLQIGLTSTVGQPWANWRPRGVLKVLVVNSEDDVMEMTRRLAAAVTVMGLADSQDEIATRFKIADDTISVVLAKFDARSKTLVRTPRLEQLVNTIIENAIDIVFVDPFAETFEGDENSNSELKWAGILWREVARRTNTAICLVHHTKKYATGMAGDVDAARGASALIGIARIVSTLFPMTRAEGDLMGITDDKRVDYLRYDDAKANLNRKSPFAKWFVKRTIILNNSAGGLPPDEVGALEPWSPLGLMDGISEDDINRFLGKLDDGLLDKNGVRTGEFYCYKKDADDSSRWAGKLLMTEFKIKVEDRAKKILKQWLEKNIVIDDTYKSPRQRKRRSFLHSENYVAPAEPELKLVPNDDKPSKPARFISSGNAPAGSVCIWCQDTSGKNGVVLKIKDNREIGGQTETLHMGCAEAYYTAQEKER
jgi:hypothetical protein